MKLLANKPIFILITSALFGVPIAAVVFFVLGFYQPNVVTDETVNIDTSHLNPQLLAIQPNQWIKLTSPWSLPWTRQAHAGSAFNAQQGSLLLFGSDTHNTNWDNSVHEFDPAREKWTTHQITSDHESYRVDANNRAIAGKNDIAPWAMHTFDNIVYDPKNNTLFIVASPEHNPKNKEFENIIHPMWIYNLNTHQWKIFENNGKPYPNLFAGATEYDPDRDTIVAYKSGIWELGPERKEWINATEENHHNMHYNMEYDKNNKIFVVFGNSESDAFLWSYKPGFIAGEKGTWTQHQPSGELPPQDQHFPAAYDEENNVFLLLPRNLKINTTSNPLTNGVSNTYIYNFTQNQYTKLPHTELEIHVMNYMMEYDTRHNVFLLVTEDESVRPAVFAFKLILENPDS